MEFQAVLDAVRALPVDDQVRLVDQIRDELGTQGVDAVADLTPEQVDELDRRLADIAANPDDVVPWEQVLAAARARHKR
jgi:putative addiction module component (TIGR02574 family)